MCPAQPAACTAGLAWGPGGVGAEAGGVDVQWAPGEASPKPSSRPPADPEDSKRSQKGRRTGQGCGRGGGGGAGGEAGLTSIVRFCRW